MRRRDAAVTFAAMKRMRVHGGGFLFLGLPFPVVMVYY
jgi:hypothetical protein